MNQNYDDVKNIPIIPYKKHETLESIRDKKNIKFLNRFINIDEECKFLTLQQAKMWASFPKMFNDIFDTQIRLNSEQLCKLACILQIIYPSHQIDYIKQLINLHIEQFHATHICSFTECDPADVTSAHMWGLYANNGTGIAIQYDINAVIEFEKSIEYRYHCNFLKVAYDHNSDPLLRLNMFNRLKYMLEQILTANCNLHIDAVLTMLTTKSIQWKYEQEWRFISLKARNYNAEHHQKLENYISNPEYYPLPTINPCYEKREILRLQKYRENSINCEFAFINPSKIIFGWNCDITPNTYYGKLYSWASNKHSIECIKIKPETIDYENGLYSTTKLA